MIIGPTGEVISDVLADHEGIVYAEIDIARCIEPKQFHDVVGYYNRFDIFRLDVDRTPRNPAAFIEAEPASKTAPAARADTSSLQANGGDRPARGAGLPPPERGRVGERGSCLRGSQPQSACELEGMVYRTHDRIANAAAARDRIEAAVGLDLGGLARQLLVLDHVTEPGRIVGGLAVVLPGAVVHSLGDLQEDHEILCTQVERVIRAAEIEAAVLSEMALGVFRGVPLVSLARTLGLHDDRTAGGAADPDEDLVGARFDRVVSRRRLLAGRFAKGLDHA